MGMRKTGTQHKHLMKTQGIKWKLTETQLLDDTQPPWLPTRVIFPGAFWCSTQYEQVPRITRHLRKLSNMRVKQLQKPHKKQNLTERLEGKAEEISPKPRRAQGKETENCRTSPGQETILPELQTPWRGSHSQTERHSAHRMRESHTQVHHCEISKLWGQIKHPTTFRKGNLSHKGSRIRTAASFSTAIL